MCSAGYHRGAEKQQMTWEAKLLGYEKSTYLPATPGNKFCSDSCCLYNF